MVDIRLIPIAEFQRINHSVPDKYTRMELIADMQRANTLAEVKRAGSGHLGSSFSSLDIVTWLYYQEMNTIAAGVCSGLGISPLMAVNWRLRRSMRGISASSAG